MRLPQQPLLGSTEFTQQSSVRAWKGRVHPQHSPLLCPLCHPALGSPSLQLTESAADQAGGRGGPRGSYLPPFSCSSSEALSRLAQRRQVVPAVKVWLEAACADVCCITDFWADDREDVFLNRQW